MDSSIVIVALTGAAGNIGSSLVYQLLKPGIFSSKPYKVLLRLIDLKEKHELLAGRIMEIEDSFFDTFAGAEIHEDTPEAFRDVDCVILAGARPRTIGMERKDLLGINARIIQNQARMINSVAKQSTRVLVVGNPSNTNALLFAAAAPNIPKENISSLSMLDFNRAVSLLAKKARVDSNLIKNVRVFGNHSKTMCIDASKAYIENFVNNQIEQQKITGLVNREFIDCDLQKNVQDRGMQIIEAMGYSSSYSAAYAIVRHLECWYRGSNELIAAGIIIDNFIGCETELCVTLPLRVHNNQFVPENNPFEGMEQKYIDRIRTSIDELILEKKLAFACIKE